MFFYVFLQLPSFSRILIRLVSTPAFADAVAPLLNAETVSFQMSVTTLIGETETTSTMLCTYQAPSRMRIEMPENDSIILLDMQADKIISLTLMPKDKTAMKMEMPLPLSKEANPQDFYTDFFDTAGENSPGRTERNR